VESNFHCSGSGGATLAELSTFVDAVWWLDGLLAPLISGSGALFNGAALIILVCSAAGRNASVFNGLLAALLAAETVFIASVCVEIFT